MTSVSDNLFESPPENTPTDDAVEYMECIAIFYNEVKVALLKQENEKDRAIMVFALDGRLFNQNGKTAIISGDLVEKAISLAEIRFKKNHPSFQKYAISKLLEIADLDMVWANYGGVPDKLKQIVQPQKFAYKEKNELEMVADDGQQDAHPRATRARL
ncbi:hypothetical protein [Rhodoferax mekongensis]|uniref:hypothetical protein n=1 Tax=Rhodoferax mekongensis TaxID=3068341 RepID=UPI0028BD202E|nr:hypothetical protein [Rhodoferax sp. TBRC 17199]MDT7514733.1 hypothetical protein [Rhodoferax sp. TBRC 17199]